MSEVTQFVTDIEAISPSFAKTINHTRQQFAHIFPAIEEKVIYGGIGFYYDQIHIGGIYPHSNHLNLIFGRGNELNDPHRLLLGKGKFRRYLRLTTVKSFEEQQAPYYLSAYASLILGK